MYTACMFGYLSPQHVPQGRAKSIGCIRLMNQTNKQREEKKKPLETFADLFSENRLPPPPSRLGKLVRFLDGKGVCRLHSYI